MNKLIWLEGGRERLHLKRAEYPFAKQEAKADGTHRFVARVTDEGNLLCMRCGDPMTGTLKRCGACKFDCLVDEITTHRIETSNDQGPNPHGA